MNEITFGQDRYHEHPDMEQWCRKYLGTGGWSYASPKTWEGMGDQSWIIHSMFGNTTFSFKNKRDFAMFLLRWA